MFELMVEETFHAAHALRGYQGPCENLHGHSWKIQLFLRGKKLNKIGLMMDFKLVKKHLRDILARYDHTLLNDLKEYRKDNPSSENLARNIYRDMKKKIKEVSKVVVWESTSACAAYQE